MLYVFTNWWLETPEVPKCCVYVKKKIIIFWVPLTWIINSALKRNQGIRNPSTSLKVLCQRFWWDLMSDCRSDCSGQCFRSVVTASGGFLICTSGKEKVSFHLLFILWKTPHTLLIICLKVLKEQIGFCRHSIQN